MNVIDVVAGIVGGIVVVLTGHPFDTTKTRLQTAPEGFYNGTLDCIRKTIKYEGVQGFYTGIQSPLAGQMIYRACHFGFFYTFKDIFHRSSGEHKASELLMAGAATGFAVSVIESPIDLLKTKLQIQVFGTKLGNFTPKYTTTVGCLRYILTTHGPIGLMQGISGTLVRNIPANAFFFSVNELSKQYMAKAANVKVENLSVPDRLLSGALAGISYWVGTYPLDMVKASMQSQNYERKLSWLTTTRLIYQSGGWRAFTKGLVPCALRSIPACGCMFATVDIVRDVLHKMADR